MAVSTATYSWNSGTLVTATGTLAEVMAEMNAGADSTASLQTRDFLVSPPYYNGTNISAVWYVNKTTGW